ncbi:hypothetical protein IFM61606_01604 [Aspergillus udagawae]|nr:hypothetical protein IFM61606_01604 [Aspergillus udagawae]
MNVLQIHILNLLLIQFTLPIKLSHLRPLLIHLPLLQPITIPILIPSPILILPKPLLTPPTINPQIPHPNTLPTPLKRNPLAITTPTLHRDVRRMELATCLVAAALHLEEPAFAEAGRARLGGGPCASAAPAGVDCWTGGAGHSSACQLAAG